MKQIWFTCPRCALQFKSAANHNHHCPRCNHYPCQIGKIKYRPAAPRITTQLPPPTSSGSFPSMSGPVRPSMTGPMQPLSGPLTQGDWPTQPSMLPPPGGPPPSRGFRSWFYRQGKGKQLGMALGAFFALILVCACCGSIVSSGGNSTAGTATATPAQVAQGQSSQSTQKPGATKTQQPSPTPKPTATATSTPTATPAPPTATPKPACPYPAVNDNPWCYTFTNTGNTITNPAPGFCGVFDCISSFANGNGYVVQCGDGKYSKSGGLSGVCSQHGGYARTLYMP